MERKKCHGVAKNTNRLMASVWPRLTHKIEEEKNVFERKLVSDAPKCSIPRAQQGDRFVCRNPSSEHPEERLLCLFFYTIQSSVLDGRAKSIVKSLMDCPLTL